MTAGGVEFVESGFYKMSLVALLHSAFKAKVPPADRVFTLIPVTLVIPPSIKEQTEHF